MKKLSFINAKTMILAFAGVAFTACNNDQYKYNELRAEEQAKDAFSQNFVKHFGAIDANQVWDFSGEPMTILSGETRSTRAGSVSNVTVSADASYAYYNAEGWFEIPASMQNSLNKIEENVDHNALGNSYAMSVPENNFTIVPLRQGYTSSDFELHMVVGSGANAVDYLLWKKGQFMQTRKVGSTGAWTDVTSENGSFTYGNVDVRSKAITFTNMNTDEPMYFYIYRPNNSTYPSSLDGFMKDFTSMIELPQQLIADGKKIKVVGCEAQFANNDSDYEDVMFMIVGDPTLPEEIIPLDKMKFAQTVSKRYLIEDLGDTDDTDYNDIVVDVKATRTITFDYNTTNGEVSNRKYSDWENEEALLRHRGGTLDFQLTIGKTVLPWTGGVLSDSPNITYNVEGWNPFENNIKVKVETGANSDGVYNIDFPGAGSVPLIIATATSFQWMEERVSIIPTLKKLIADYNAK